MTEWTPGEWSSVKPGDTVKLEHGDGTALPGIVQQINKAKGQRLGVATVMGWKQTTQWAYLGWSVFVPAPPKPELPTEPGHYLDADGRHWLHQTYDGTAYGEPSRDVDQWINWHGDPDSPLNYPGSHPLVKLAPEAETAKKVLLRIREVYGEDYIGNENFIWNRVAEEFGVSL